MARLALPEVTVVAAQAEGFHRGRDPRLRELRQLVAVLGVEKFEQRVREIAAVLEKNPGSVSRWVSTAAEDWSNDPGFALRLRELDEMILAGRAVSPSRHVAPSKA